MVDPLQAASALPEHADASYRIMHSPRALLVDANGRVRGLYDTTEPEAMERLRRDLRSLLERRHRLATMRVRTAQGDATVTDLAIRRVPTACQRMAGTFPPLRV